MDYIGSITEQHGRYVVSGVTMFDGDYRFDLVHDDDYGLEDASPWLRRVRVQSIRLAWGQ